ncbi:armadillo-type protein [Geopyxis carbonaria]|nr:armadillo-type protein [Geopyxis carbonaria]
MAEEEPDYSSIPLTERAVHKIWKVRKGAYEEAAKQFESSPDESDACFTPWMMDPGLWDKAVKDSNVAAQQEGVAAYCAFLQYGGQSACLRTRGHCVGSLVEKCLSSTRAATKGKATEALLLLVELDTAAPVMEQLIPYLSHKMAKIVAVTATAITNIYAQFGAKTVDPKPVLKVFPKVFGHADKNVRAESTKLAIELYKWLKEAMKPIFFDELKPAQQKELEEAFEKVKDESPKPERLLRSQQAALAAAEAAGTAADAEAEEEPEQLDVFDLAEPIDINSKLPADFEDHVASTKWKERKEALDALFIVLNVPRIKDGQYDHIIRPLAKCMKDANVAVVTVAANCIEAFANGMRKSFAKYKGIVLGPVLERLKEKKQGVIDALTKALDAVFVATGLTDMLEEITEFSKNKNPNVKLETIRFLVRCLRNTRDFPTKMEQKQIADTSGKLLTESSAPIRDSAAEAMGTLMKILGERAMNPYLEGLDDIRKTKIKEYFETAEVKAKEKPKPPPPAPVAAKGPPKKVLGKGLKAPGKKLAPAGSSASGAGGAPPTSKLAGPKGGLKLQKKVLAPGGGNAAPVASPKRALPPKAQSPVDDEPAPPPARSGLGRGLAGRPLSKEPPMAAPVPRVDPMAAADKAELEELRSERERWEKQSRDANADKTRMMQEINDLQLQNAQLIEEHTRDNLAIRAKEAQLVRARSDAESAQEEVAKQKREIDRLKRELQRSVRPTSPAPTDISEHIMNGLSRDTGRSNSNSRSSNRLSYASTSISGEEKDNGHLHADRGSAMSPPLRGSSESGRASSAGGENIESWKRAAEVTSQLKMRIEVGVATLVMLILREWTLLLTQCFSFGVANEGQTGHVGQRRVGTLLTARQPQQQLRRRNTRVERRADGEDWVIVD